MTYKKIQTCSEVVTLRSIQRYATFGIRVFARKNIVIMITLKMTAKIILNMESVKNKNADIDTDTYVDTGEKVCVKEEISVHSYIPEKVETDLESTREATQEAETVLEVLKVPEVVAVNQDEVTQTKNAGTQGKVIVLIVLTTDFWMWKINGKVKSCSWQGAYRTPNPGLCSTKTVCFS